MNYYMLPIPRQTVEGLDTKSVINQIKSLEQASGTREVCQHLMIFIDGYNDVPEELYEIPEVVKFVKKLVNEFPRLFYYINPADENGFYIAASLSDETTIISDFPLGERKPTSAYEIDQLPKFRAIIRLKTSILRRFERAIIEHGARMKNPQGAAEAVKNLNSMFPPLLN